MARLKSSLHTFIHGKILSACGHSLNVRVQASTAAAKGCPGPCPPPNPTPCSTTSSGAQSCSEAGCWPRAFQNPCCEWHTLRYSQIHPLPYINSHAIGSKGNTTTAPLRSQCNFSYETRVKCLQDEPPLDMCFYGTRASPVPWGSAALCSGLTLDAALSCLPAPPPPSPPLSPSLIPGTCHASVQPMDGNGLQYWSADLTPLTVRRDFPRDGVTGDC